MCENISNSRDQSVACVKNRGQRHSELSPAFLVQPQPHVSLSQESATYVISVLADLVFLISRAPIFPGKGVCTQKCTASVSPLLSIRFLPHLQYHNWKIFLLTEENKGSHLHDCSLIKYLDGRWKVLYTVMASYGTLVFI